MRTQGAKVRKNSLPAANRNRVREVNEQKHTPTCHSNAAPSIDNGKRRCRHSQYAATSDSHLPNKRAEMSMQPEHYWLHQQGEAFGSPGLEPRWTSSMKDAVCTAYSMLEVHRGSKPGEPNASPCWWSQ